MNHEYATRKLSIELEHGLEDYTADEFKRQMLRIVGGAIGQDLEKLESENKRLRTNLDESSDLLIEQKTELVNCKAENKRLREFKEFVNMMILRNLDHIVSDYETIASIGKQLENDQS